MIALEVTETYMISIAVCKLAIDTLNSNVGVEAIEYLLKRGLSKELIEIFN